MSKLSALLKSGIAIKAMQIAKREASKPENQRKAKEMLDKARNRGAKGTTPR